MNKKNTAKFYKDNNYVIIKNFIPKFLAKFIYNYCLMRSSRAKFMLDSKWPGYRPDPDGTFFDKQVSGTYSSYADPLMETLLIYGHKQMENITGLRLHPTYSYWRMYKNNDILARHKDRMSCEVSTTLCLGYDTTNIKDKNYDWPMYIDKTGKEGNKGIPVYMKPGDMIVYRGCLVEHWREPFLGKNHAQVFLHYNNADGPYKDDCLYDGRPALGLPGDFINPVKRERMVKADYELDRIREKERKETN
jgi:hypothetical protein